MPWLVKSEADVYSITDLEWDGETCWDGVRNYQARNLMRDMKVGDPVLFYHSNSDPLGVVGVAEVCREAYPDHTQFDPKSPTFDAKADPEAPRWEMVDVRFVARLPRVVTLADIKAEPKLANMPLVQRGQRLSVQPVKEEQFRRVLAMGGLESSQGGRARAATTPGSSAGTRAR